MTHKDWLDNEYIQWVKALQESTVHNFKEHPVVKRMLGDPYADWLELIDQLAGNTLNWELLYKIDYIGHTEESEDYSQYRLFRIVYYALEILKRNPTSIFEIGGGVGQFYAILRALGYKGGYYIMDKADVISFMFSYLYTVQEVTGLSLMPMRASRPFDLIVSFYALGEFDDHTKNDYTQIIDQTPHGYIAWNPHSGASDDLSLFKHDIKVTPGIEEGIKIITW